MIIRVDADHQIGMGHLVRCLAIADSMSLRDVSVRFAMSQPDERVKDLVRARGHELRPIRARKGQLDDAAETIELAVPNEVILIDGYQFSDDFERRLADRGLKVAVIDDYGHADHLDARIIINSNLYYGRTDLYSRAAGAQLLLGPRFLPIRNELTDLRTLQSANQEVNSLLVSFGSGDVRRALPATIEVLRSVLPSRVKIFAAVVSMDDESARHLQQESRDIEWIEDFSRLPEVMASVDMAIAAGGMLSYELAFMGVPSILLPATTIQSPVAAELARLGAAIDLGLSDVFPYQSLGEAVQELLRSPQRRQSMIEEGQALFDGHGARRCAEALFQLSSLTP
jgi:UDP-2,4-diacetamido-2,4,6-trideoxy-beta-L-altropyranose hydrolase